MDLSAAVERALEEMEWGEVVTTLTAAVHELLSGTTNLPSPPSPTPAPVSAGLDPNTQPQPAESRDEGYGDWIPAQGQYLPYLWPVEDIPTAADVSYPAAALPQTAAAFSHPAPPPQPFTSVPVVKLAEGQSLRLVGVLNGQLLYEVVAEDAAPPVYAAPPQDTSKKRKRDSQQDEDRPYVKKPPNAFMLFLKEQRANVQAEVGCRGSAAVNTILGERWRSLTKEQQAKYYCLAETERLLHSQQHPEWSTLDNYGKKTKRQRGKASRLESLKPMPTSLTSPLAPTQTYSPPTARTLEERCHPTTVTLCRPTA